MLKNQWMFIVICMLFANSAAYSDSVEYTFQDSALMVSTPDKPVRYDLSTKAKRMRIAATAMVITGTAGAAAGGILGGLFVLVGYPLPGAAILTGAAGSATMAFCAIPMYRNARIYQQESGVIYKKDRQFRMTLQLQGYIDQSVIQFDTVFLGNPEAESKFRWIAESKTLVPRPNFAAELGVITASNMYFGVYGQLKYIGGMGVFFYEWNPEKRCYLSVGMKGGYMSEAWTDVMYSAFEPHHTQFGGPEFRASFGSKSFRISSEFQLWFDKMAQYNRGDFNDTPDYPGDSYISWNERLVGFAPTSIDFGVSPAVSIKLQAGIPF